MVPSAAAGRATGRQRTQPLPEVERYGLLFSMSRALSVSGENDEVEVNLSVGEHQ
jgi:hypothetical protein